jgi:F0F1-type ATP synthase assembly protein I
MNVLSGWENFYVIVGSSAGALIGLQFVVFTLIADVVQGPEAAKAGEAFGTPTVVHFGATLLLAAIASAPFRSVATAAIVLGLLGVIGIVYEMVVLRRMRQQKAYDPEGEDWLFHGFLPLAAYLILAGSAYAAWARHPDALFGVASSALLLLFVGIHNAWDAVTYHVYYQRHKIKKKEDPAT